MRPTRLWRIIPEGLRGDVTVVFGEFVIHQQIEKTILNDRFLLHAMLIVLIGRDAAPFIVDYGQPY